MTTDGGGVSSGDDEHILKVDSGDYCQEVHEKSRYHSRVCLNRMKYLMGELPLNKTIFLKSREGLEGRDGVPDTGETTDEH